MLKLRYDNITGRVGKAYNTDMTIPEPYLEITKEQNDSISTDLEHIYFVENGSLLAKNKLKIEQAEYWNKNFFLTSLGWIRREPILADGTRDNFLNNNLPLFALGMLSGQTVILPIAYNMPDFTQELSDVYMATLQIKNQAVTMGFINECTAVKLADFTG